LKEKLLPLGTPGQITKLIEGESDRGIILILGAYLEEILGDIIRTSCTSDEIADHLLEFRQPAGDFSSKISLCLAFGFIHSSEAQALNTIRKIRNAAAHFNRNAKGFDVLFDADQTIDLVGNLSEVLNLGRPDRDQESVKGLFIIASRLLATKLMIRGILTRKAEAPLEIKELANYARETLQGTEAGKKIAELDAADLETKANFFKELSLDLRTQLEKSLSDKDSTKHKNA
jgi:hypothetical protein